MGMREGPFDDRFLQSWMDQKVDTSPRHLDIHHKTKDMP